MDLYEDKYTGERKTILHLDLDSLDDVDIYAANESVVVA